MHEEKIAKSILEAGRAEASRLAGARLKRIGVRVGVLSGVDLQALEFALLALRVGTDLEDLEIDLRSCQQRTRCMVCGFECEPGIYSGACCRCGSDQIELVGGDELEIAFVEIDEG